MLPAMTAAGESPASIPAPAQAGAAPRTLPAARSFTLRELGHPGRERAAAESVIESASAALSAHAVPPTLPG
jgi:hypothetical protein